MPNENRELTTRQKDALKVYAKFVEQHGRPPSVREYGEALGVSHRAAHFQLQKLKEKGRITMVRMKVSAKGLKAG
jgi:SOS-response transcriptional repressor LexA